MAALSVHKNFSGTKRCVFVADCSNFVIKVSRSFWLAATPPERTSALAPNVSIACKVFFTRTETIVFSSDAHKSYNICFSFFLRCVSSTTCCQPTFVCFVSFLSRGKCCLVVLRKAVLSQENEKS